MRRFFIAIAITLLTLVAQLSPATVWYVSPSYGSNDSTGVDWKHALATIAAAEDSACGRGIDSIFVAAGDTAREKVTFIDTVRVFSAVVDSVDSTSRATSTTPFVVYFPNLSTSDDLIKVEGDSGYLVIHYCTTDGGPLSEPNQARYGFRAGQNTGPKGELEAHHCVAKHMSSNGFLASYYTGGTISASYCSSYCNETNGFYVGTNGNLYLDSCVSLNNLWNGLKIVNADTVVAENIRSVSNGESGCYINSAYIVHISNYISNMDALTPINFPNEANSNSLCILNSVLHLSNGNCTGIYYSGLDTLVARGVIIQGSSGVGIRNIRSGHIVADHLTLVDLDTAICNVSEGSILLTNSIISNAREYAIINDGTGQFVAHHNAFYRSGCDSYKVTDSLNVILDQPVFPNSSQTATLISVGWDSTVARFVPYIGNSEWWYRKVAVGGDDGRPLGALDYTISR